MPLLFPSRYPLLGVLKTVAILTLPFIWILVSDRFLQDQIQGLDNFFIATKEISNQDEKAHIHLLSFVDYKHSAGRLVCSAQGLRRLKHVVN